MIWNHSSKSYARIQFVFVNDNGEETKLKNLLCDAFFELAALKVYIIFLDSDHRIGFSFH